MKAINGMGDNRTGEMPPSQLDKFKETARAIECDEDEEAFKRSLQKVAKAKPAPVKPK